MIVKQVTAIEKLFTYHEFVDRGEWKDFVVVFNAVKRMTDLKYRIIRQEDYIWSRVAECVKDELPFHLMYHEDWGTILYNSEKQSDEK